jgi:hypothetical protein
MSAERSPGAAKRYGLQRICQVLGMARSSLYAARQRARSNGVALHPGRRGPKPKLADAELLAAIHADLAASPFIGEGHRKVWARLRLQQGIRVSRTRVLRLMREQRLLSPHRQPRGMPNDHDGHITTEAPDLMWGTDAIRIETVEEGWGGYSAPSITAMANAWAGTR